MSAEHDVTVVTGAGGFLGGAVLRSLSPLVGSGHVVGCVRAADSRADWPAGVERVVADLATADGVVRLRTALGRTTGPVRLVLLAGGYRPGSFAELFRINVGTTLATLEAAAERVRHVVHASSVAVYGSHRLRCPNGRPQAAPDTEYGWSKWLAENALQLFARDHEIPLAVLRLSSLYGRGNPGGNAVAALTRAAASKHPFVIARASSQDAGGALYARDYLWIGDAARAVAAASWTSFAGNLNVSSGYAASPRDLVDIVRATGQVVTVDDRAAGSPVLRFSYDPRPARQALGTGLPRALAEGITDELAWRVAETSG